MKTVSSSELRSQYLSFFLAGEEYGISILRVREIVEYDVPTRVPAMPACVTGVINLRGRVVPIIDLAVRFGLAPSVATRRSCIVVVELVLEGEPVVMGVIVDAVSQVLELAPEAIEPPPSFGTAICADFLEGMTQSLRKFVLLLDIDRALTVQGLAAGVEAGAELQSAPGSAPAAEREAVATEEAA